MFTNDSLNHSKQLLCCSMLNQILDLVTVLDYT